MSEALLKSHAKLLITGVIVTIILTGAFRPIELYSLELNEVRFVEIDGVKIL